MSLNCSDNMPHCKNCNDHFEKIRRCGVKTSRSRSNELGFSVVGYQSAGAVFLKEGSVGYDSNERIKHYTDYSDHKYHSPH